MKEGWAINKKFLAIAIVIIVIIGLSGAVTYQTTFANNSPQTTPIPTTTLTPEPTIETTPEFTTEPTSTPTATPEPTPIPVTISYTIDGCSVSDTGTEYFAGTSIINVTVTISGDESVTLYSDNFGITRYGQPLTITWMWNGGLDNPWARFNITGGQEVQFSSYIEGVVESIDGCELVYNSSEYNVNCVQVTTPTPAPTPTPTPTPVTYLEIGVPYKASDNMTVTLTSLNVIETDGSYQYKITYTLKNENPDTEIDEGQFKAYYADGSGGEPQYGFFNSLFYNQSITRSYTFEELKSKPFSSIAYGPDLFFSSQPPSDALIWAVEIPSV